MMRILSEAILTLEVLSHAPRDKRPGYCARMTACVRLFCLRHGGSANVVAGAAGVLPSAPLTPNGHAVVFRMTRALDAIVDAHPGATAVVVGHVASLTASLATICDLGTEVWGAPLPYAVPFLVVRTPDGWQCKSWPSCPGTSGQR